MRPSSGGGTRDPPRHSSGRGSAAPLLSSRCAGARSRRPLFNTPAAEPARRSSPVRLGANVCRSRGLFGAGAPLPLSGSCAGGGRRARGHAPCGGSRYARHSGCRYAPFFFGYRPDQRCGACPGFPFALPALAFAQSCPAPSARQLQTFFVSRRGREGTNCRARPSGAAPSRGVRSDPRPPEPPAVAPTRRAVFFIVLG